MRISKIAIFAFAAGVVAASGAQAALRADQDFTAMQSGAVASVSKPPQTKVALNPQPLPPFVAPEFDEEFDGR